MRSFIVSSFISRVLRRLVYSIVRGWLSKGILFAVYDLEHYPISYDIIWFLVWVDLKRRREGLKHLQCVFVPCRDKTTEQLREGYDAVVDSQSRAWRFNNICVEATALVPGCGCVVSNTRAMADDMAVIARMFATSANPDSLPTIYRETIDGLTAEGSNWNGLSASIQGRRYTAQWLEAHIGNRKPVIITLRQYGFDAIRNSALEEWAAFAKNLDLATYGPVIIPDTDNAMAPVPELADFPHFSEAAWNLGLRMAVNELAYLNMFVNSGPGSLCFLNRKCRYLFFKVTTPTILATDKQLRRLGFEPGQSPKFATPFQKWVWEPDNRDILRREFDAMVSKIETL